MDDTIACVESIVSNIKYDNYNIVIVDNGSPNDSGKLLQDRYERNAYVHLILSDKNLGFAKGNNLGFKYAKEKLNSNFICLINNDCLIFQHDFIQKILNKYDDERYYVLGPDIISLVDDSHQNPHGIRAISKVELQRWRLRVFLFLILNYLHIEDILMRIKIKLFKTNMNNEEEIIDYQKEQKNVLLHGSCLIFSPDFINQFQGLCPKTFLYFEEDILYFQSQTHGFLMLYSPEVIVYHKEDKSIDSKFDKETKKKRFKYKNILKSSKVLLDMINKRSS
jgi:GT2 family glycosyltransferase